MLKYYEDHDLLPGFVEGFSNIARDEHRHVAYGTWFLQQKTAEDESLKKRVQDKLMELLPVAAGVLVPPGYQLGDDYEFFGYTSKEQSEFAFTALTRRLKVIGVGYPSPLNADPGSARSARWRGRKGLEVVLDEGREGPADDVDVLGGHRLLAQPSSQSMRRRAYSSGSPSSSRPPSMAPIRTVWS